MPTCVTGVAPPKAEVNHLGLTKTLQPSLPSGYDRSAFNGHCSGYPTDERI